MANSKVVLGASLGNIIEWYDFSLFGFMAPTLSKLFFPQQSHLLAIMATYIILAASFVMRPIGALMYGYFGDTAGRKNTLLVSVLLVGAPAFIIGCLPTFHSIGIAAPVILLLLRLLAGFSVGGEFGGSVTLLVESAAAEKRGFYAGIAIAAAMVGVLLAAVVANIVVSSFTAKQLVSYAWRIPFLLSIFAIALGYYFRSNMRESPIFTSIKDTTLFTLEPLQKIFKYYFSTLLQAALVVALGFVINFTILVYFPTYLTTVRHFSDKLSLSLSVVGLVVVILSALLSSYFSLRFSRRKVMLIVCVLSAISAVAFAPIFATGSYHQLLLLIVLFSVLEGVYFGLQMTYLAELFPAKVRYTGLSFSYNLGSAVFVGSTLALVSYLIHILTIQYAFMLLLVVASVCSFIGLLLYRKPQVLFIPGLSFGKDLFRHQMEYFCDTLNAKTHVLKHSKLQANLDDIGELFPRGRFTIVAHSSIGAGVALAAAAQTERITNVICLPGWVKPNQFTVEFLQQSLQQLENGDYDAFTKQLREIAVGENYPNRQQLMQEIKQIQETVPVLQTVRQCQLLLNQLDITPILKQIKARVLVVRNVENDPWFTQVEADQLAAAVENGLSLLIDNHGHLTPYTSPRNTNALIELWLNK